jgi:hypothetical protein
MLRVYSTTLRDRSSSSSSSSMRRRSESAEGHKPICNVPLVCTIQFTVRSDIVGQVYVWFGTDITQETNVAQSLAAFRLMKNAIV